MKQISIEIIHKCPNRCFHCSSNSDINCTLKIETAEVKKIINSASKLNTEVLSISGGEPFLHDGLLEIVHYAKSKGIKVYIYTSGIILNIAGRVDSIQQELLQQLYSVAVDKIIFDLPAINEAIYNKFMGTSGYQKFVFESINKAQNIGICTEIHFVPTKINLDEIDNIVKFEREVKEFLIKRLQDRDIVILYNTTSNGGITAFNLEGIFSQDTALYLDHYNICVRAGNHCAKVLKEEINIKNTCRISLYFYNTKEEIDKLIDALKNSEDLYKIVL